MHLCGQSGMPLAGRKPGEGTRAEAASPGTAGVWRIRDACWWTRSEARSACRCRDRTRGLGCVGKEREAHAKQRGCENLRESRACSSMMRRGMIQKQVLRHGTRHAQPEVRAANGGGDGQWDADCADGTPPRHSCTSHRAMPERLSGLTRARGVPRGCGGRELRRARVDGLRVDQPPRSLTDRSFDEIHFIRTYTQNSTHAIEG